jgi:hypothetical protein
VIFDKPSRKATDLYKDKIKHLLYIDVMEYLPKGIVIEMDDDYYEQIMDTVEQSGHDFEMVE